MEIFSLVCTVAIALLAKHVSTCKEFALASAHTKILHMLELNTEFHKKNYIYIYMHAHLETICEYIYIFKSEDNDVKIKKYRHTNIYSSQLDKFHV